MIRFMPLAILVMFGAILVLATIAERASRASVSLVGSPLPPLIVAPLDHPDKSEILAMSDGPVLLHLFASWCTPCIAEMPVLHSLQAQGVPIIAIAWNDTPQALQSFLHAHGNPFQHIYLDNTGEAITALGMRGVPESLAVDAKGIVRAQWHGPITTKETLPFFTLPKAP